ncbi:MAG TPA: hypothetical protein VKF59_04285 [Candidatus Dormibacteraeota bacterium]|nr:hypothetical protein [Candidatus Dormibacteraeota bacterium]
MPWPLAWWLGPLGRVLRSPVPSPAAPPAPVAAGVSRPRAEQGWASLPPIPRAAGDLELTARAREFATGLPGAAGLPLALQPLAHARTLEAPPGLVAGLAASVPVQAYAGQEPLVLAERRPGRPPGQAREAWSWPEEAGADAAPGVAGQPPPAAEPTPAAAHEAASAAALPPAAAPRPVPSLPLTPAAPLVAGARPEAGSTAPPEPARSGAEAPAGELPPPPRRLNVGQSRRLGLGAPLPPGPERLAPGGDEPAAGPAAPAAPATSTVQAAQAMDAGRAALPPPSPPPPATGGPPRLPAPRQPEATPGAAAARPAGPPSRSTSPSSGLAGPIHRVQRRPAGRPADGNAGPEGATRPPGASEPPIGPSAEIVPAPAPGSPVPARREGPAEAPAAATPAEPAAGGLAADEPGGPARAAAAAPFEAGARPLLAPLAAPLRVSRQAAAGGRTAPRPADVSPVSVSRGTFAWPPAGPAPALTPVPASVQSADPWLQRATVASEPRWPALAAPAAAARLPEPEWAAAGPELAPAFVAASRIAVQRAPEAGAGADAGPGAGAEPGRAVGAVPGAGAGAGAHSDQELDSLAHLLYDRLRSRLRMELLIDRERAGLITDLL